MFNCSYQASDDRHDYYRIDGKRVIVLKRSKEGRELYHSSGRAAANRELNRVEQRQIRARYPG